MEVVLDVCLKFPIKDGEYQKLYFNKLTDFCQCVENVERDFGIEFSCGDGKFLSDLWKWTDSEEGLVCTATDEELEKYDGNVCLRTPARRKDNCKLLAINKTHRFIVKFSKPDEEYVFYLNNRVTSRRFAR